METITEQEVLAWARELFPKADFKSWTQRTRPRICPFGPLVNSVLPGSEVLDIGCGSGLLLGLLARAGRSKLGVGFDADGKAIRAALEMSRNSGLGSIDFVEMPVGAAWPRGEFDTVMAVDVLHHIPQAQRQPMLHEALDKLPRGGRFILKDIRHVPDGRPLQIVCMT